MHQRSAHRSLLVVGSVALDDIDGPFGLHKDLLGGSASFIARAASYFTTQRLGRRRGRRRLPAAATSTSWPRSASTSRASSAGAGETFHWVGKYAPDLATRETLDTRLGVFADFQPKLNDAHKDAQLVLLGNIDPGAPARRARARSARRRSSRPTR